VILDASTLPPNILTGVAAPLPGTILKHPVLSGTFDDGLTMMPNIGEKTAKTKATEVA
jgi:hypothetical protein